MELCVNCGIATSRTMGRRALDDERTLSVIRQWLSPQPVNNSDHVCQACWDLAQKSPVGSGPRKIGHHNVCLRCGRSLASRHSHQLQTDSTREMRIYIVIQQWIMPRTVEEASRICHRCWVAADRAAPHLLYSFISSQESTMEEKQSHVQEIPTGPSNEEVENNQPEPTIVLPDYVRAIETERRCFIPGCRSTQRCRVPHSTRKMLLNKYKYYVPENNRLCNQHLDTEAWDLDSLQTNRLQSFTAKHIQHMLSL